MEARTMTAVSHATLDPVKADYSQYGEQSHILRALGLVGSSLTWGRFLDIGAFHPTELSNTRALYELGWSGVMIEGAPGPLQSLIREYGNDPRITLVSGFLGFPEQLARVHVTDNCVSTTEDDEYEKLKATVAFTGSVYMPVFSLSWIFDAFGSQFDFVNIDTEGTSVELFRQMLCHREFWAKRFRPLCICVEHNGRLKEAISMASDTGYYTVHQNSTNIIFRGAK
jgi:FkbM family methyltransferase